MRTTLLYLFLIVLPFLAKSQEIKGKVANQQKQSISFASIHLLTATDSVLVSTNTDANGNFTINISDNIKSKIHYLQVEHVSYAKRKMLFNEFKNEGSIELEQKKDLLDQVVVKSRPMIRQKGDTTSYNVSSFAKDEDRSIGDVMNRMPGMQYTDDGKIFYNGQRVNNLLVDGDKILGSNIKLGADAIQKDQVKDLEVIKDYHDKKMDKGKVESDEMAVNLKLKDNLPLKLSSLNQIAVGLDKLYDVKSDITGFNQKFKLVSSTQFNNIGKDLSLENKVSSYLSGSNVNRPAIDLNRYYNNQSWKQTTAFSKKFMKRLDFNTQFSFFADKDIFGSTNEQKYLLENDQYIYSEKQINRTKPLSTQLSASLETNESNYFFRNRSSFNFQLNNVQNNSILNGTSIDQRFEQKYMEFKNEFEYNKNLKKNFSFHSNWSLTSQQGTEELSVYPNISIEQWKDENLNQQFKLPSWSNRVDVSLRKKANNFIYSVGAEHIYTNKNLFSELSILNDLPLTLWENQLRWRENRTSINTTVSYITDRVNFTLNNKMVNGDWNIYDTIAKFENKENKWFANPRLFFRYNFANQHYIQLIGNYNRAFENIETMFRNPILRNYRSLEQKLNTLNYKDIYSAILDWKFNNAYTLAFYNLGASYFSQNANYIISSRLTENGVENFTLPMENKVDNWEVRGGFSKIFNETKTNATLNVKSNWSLYNQLLNEQLYAYLMRTYNIELKISQDIGSRITLSTAWEKANSINKIRNENLKIPSTEFNTNKINSKITYSANGKFILSASWKYHHVQQSNSISWNYNFVDASARYKLNKKLELEMMLYNLTNVRRFETFSLTSIVENHSVYNLRGRMGLLKVNFSL